MGHITNMISGIVTIVGRPNVGKSTLFNALTRSRDALVDDQPGVTRDRIYGRVEYADSEDKKFWLVDTGGFETKGAYYQPFGENIVWQQTEQAIEEADLIVLLLDSKEGLHPHDRHLAQFLRSKGKKTIYVVNKVDTPAHEMNSNEFYELGGEELLAISAAHQRNVGVLREKISDALNALTYLAERRSAGEDATAIALVGRPNVGKSSILNRLVGESRSLVSEIAGTTRDVVDTPMTYNQQPYVIIDTAGIRKKSKVHAKIEVLSVLKSLRAIENSDIVVLVVDAMEGFGEQEARLASTAVGQLKALLIVVNKWDLVPEKESNTSRDMADAIRDRIKTLSYVPVIFISCLENQRVFKIFEEVEKLRVSYAKRVSTSELNRALETVVAEHTPALIRNHSKRVKFYYATQVLTKPPTIVVKCNLAEEIQESYKRYMMNRFREILGFEQTPMRLIFRGKDKTSNNPEISASH